MHLGRTTGSLAGFSKYRCARTQCTKKIKAHQKNKRKHTEKRNGIGHGTWVVRRVLHEDTVTRQKQTDATIHNGAADGWENLFT